MYDERGLERHLQICGKEAKQMDCIYVAENLSHGTFESGQALHMGDSPSVLVLANNSSVLDMNYTGVSNPLQNLLHNL